MIFSKTQVQTVLSPIFAQDIIDAVMIDVRVGFTLSLSPDLKHISICILDRTVRSLLKRGELRNAVKANIHLKAAMIRVRLLPFYSN